MKRAPPLCNRLTAAVARFHIRIDHRRFEKINATKYPAIIISSSGMVTGGRTQRVLRHRFPGEPQTLKISLLVGAHRFHRAAFEQLNVTEMRQGKRSQARFAARGLDGGSRRRIVTRRRINQRTPPTSSR